MLFTSKKEPVAYTAEEALEFIFENNLSKQQYLNMQHGTKFRNKMINKKNEIDQQIEKLSDFKMELPNDKVLKINYKLYMTLIDGKILNILTDTKSSHACPICGATPQKFINIKEFRSKEFTPTKRKKPIAFMEMK